MTNKFEIGSSWKTRGGWRAVVVDVNKRFISVWHKHAVLSVMIHNLNGTSYSNQDESLDLISPWVEPREYDVWINIYEDGDGDGSMYRTKKYADLFRQAGCIACVNLKFKKGDGL